MSVKIGQNEFKTKVLSGEGLILVDFFATWCGPCKMLAPVLDEISAEHGDKVAIYKIDVDENRDISVEYGVRSIPTLIFFRNGEVLNTIIGAQPKNELVKLINSL